MNDSTKVTSEELVKLACKRFTIHNTDNPATLVVETILDLYPNKETKMVATVALTNSVEKAIEKMRRDNAANVSKFVNIDQMELFGAKEHKIPKVMMTESVAKVEKFMRIRARIEKENADELRKAADTQMQVANEFAKNHIQTQRVRQGVVDNNMDPDEVTYAEAIKMSKTFQQRNEHVPV